MDYDMPEDFESCRDCRSCQHLFIEFKHFCVDCDVDYSAHEHIWNKSIIQGD